MMNEYLRDFINDNVGEECGGNQSIVNPNTIQKQLNDLKRRVDQLEGGVGLTVSIPDSISLPFSEKDSVFSTLIPDNGTITRLTILASDAGDATGLDGVTLTHYATDGTSTDTTYELDNTYKSQTLILSITVYANEWLELKAIPHTTSEDTPQTQADEDNPSTPTTTPSTILSCLGVLTFPAKTYGATNA